MAQPAIAFPSWCIESAVSGRMRYRFFAALRRDGGASQSRLAGKVAPGMLDPMYVQPAVAPQLQSAFDKVTVGFFMPGMAAIPGKISCGAIFRCP